MILQKEIIEIAEKKRLKTQTIDKDWVLGHLLNAIYSIDNVKDNFIFKGGTALKKCYFNNYRFSEDLDFTLMNKNFVVDEKFIQKVIKKTAENSGIRFHLFKQKFQKSDDEGQGYEIKIQYWGADHKPNQKPLPPARWQKKIKLDISYSEKLLIRPETKNIFHEYTDNELISNTVMAYSLYEVISEKLRSLIQRNRPRDVYDIDYLSKLFPESSYSEIKRLLFLKAEDKNIKINSISDFVNEKKENSNKRAWQSSLGDHLPIGDLPDFDTVYNNIKQFIDSILKS